MRRIKKVVKGGQEQLVKEGKGRGRNWDGDIQVGELRGFGSWEAGGGTAALPAGSGSIESAWIAVVDGQPDLSRRSRLDRLYCGLKNLVAEVK
jgi:hypothetical protein